MAEIAIGIDVLLHVAEVFRQLLSYRHLLLMLLDLDLAGLGHLLGDFLYLTLLLLGEVHTLKVELHLVGVIGSLALLAHLSPELTGQISIRTMSERSSIALQATLRLHGTTVKLFALTKQKNSINRLSETASEGFASRRED